MGAASIVRYPGGKTKLGNQIVQRLVGQAGHDGLEYREPFFGGGSIGLKLLSDNAEMKRIWINDRDIGVAGVDPVLRQPHRLCGGRAGRVDLGVGTASTDQFGELRMPHGQGSEQEPALEHIWLFLNGGAQLGDAPLDFLTTISCTSAS